MGNVLTFKKKKIKNLFFTEMFYKNKL